MAKHTTKGTGHSMFISPRKIAHIPQINCEKQKLVLEVRSIYNDSWRVRGVLPFMINDFINQLNLTGKYRFGPVVYYQINIKEIPPLIYDVIRMEASKGYLWLDERNLDTHSLIGVYKCRVPMDLLVLKGLSNVILTTVNKAQPNISKFKDLKAMHYAFLNRQENVVKVVSIDLSDCMDYIPTSRILTSQKFTKQYGLYYNLVERIIDLPIYDFHNHSFFTSTGITPIGEITHVILHNFYQNTVDSLLESRYPGITYSRYGHELFILCKQTDEFTIDDCDIDNILEVLDLYSVDINWSSDGLLMADNNDKALILHEDGSLEVWNSEDI